MDVLDRYVKFYGLLHDRKWLYYRILSPIRYAVRKRAYKVLPNYLSQLAKSSVEPYKGLIVSLTSFPARIDNVWQVVECMLRQSVRPEKIILWLSEQQFPNEESLPQSLRERIGDVFEVRFVSGDIRSHKKYYYAAQEYGDKLVFLIDDDIYYPTDIIERSLDVYKKNKNTVVCNYGRRITYDSSGEHLCYSQWDDDIRQANGDDLFLGTGGGTLLCFNELYKDVTDVDLALSLTPTADDIWINTMIKLAGLRVMTASNGFFLPMDAEIQQSLMSVNLGQSMNDKQIEAIENKYGRIFDKKV